MNKIQQLKQQLQSFSKYGSALALLSWDEEVNLPPAAHNFRGEVSAELSAFLHNKITDDKLYELICELDQAKADLSDTDKVIVRETKRDVEQARKLPTEFVTKMSLLTTKAFSTWVEARNNKEFKIFSPVLAEIIEMKKEEAELIGYKDSPYDALLDEYEPGMTVEKVDKVFTPLAAELTKLIYDAGLKAPADLPVCHYEIEAQKKLNEEVARGIGYDFSRGRIDASPHPFTIGFHPSDVRVTTRYDEKDFWGSLGSVIHEVGHALYEQGLPDEEYGTPLGEAVSLGIHESQSRGWENFVGRSRSFSSYLYPLLKQNFPGIKYSEEQLFQYLNRIKPNPIRTESDEVTYNMHIVLRYELEKALIGGKLSVGDLPAAWNQKVRDYLGLDIKNDAQGVLQDVHWSHGSFGYFPTYTLGNLYAAQFYDSAKKAIPGLEDGYAKGKFSDYLRWLRENIHCYGRQYSASELVLRITGEELDSKYLLNHLREKVALNC